MKIYITKLDELDINVVLFNINKFEDVIYADAIGFYDDVKVPESIKIKYKITMEKLTKTLNKNNMEKL